MQKQNFKFDRAMAKEPKQIRGDSLLADKAINADASATKIMLDSSS
jgi:hypothetical protein